MSGEIVTTLVGNLVEDPALRFTASGQAVANLTVAVTPRKFDKDSNQWVDGDTTFIRGSIWREPAENVAESLEKGSRVIVSGRLQQRSYEKDGEKRTVIEMEIDEIGPSLRYATAKVNRAHRESSNRGEQGGNRRPTNTRGGSRQQPADDPWGSAPVRSGAGNADPWGDDQPPF